jgi:GNAT superfamily N-acetyltransferase
VAVGIFNLHERPQHAAAVARRIWKAFWQHKGTPLALVIDNDEPARPDLTPWLAALWVDEAVRGRGIAGALLDEAARRCAALDVPRLYLVSRPALQDFYTARGWRIVERDVGAHAQTLYVRRLDRKGCA